MRNNELKTDLFAQFSSCNSSFLSHHQTHESSSVIVATMQEVILMICYVDGESTSEIAVML